MVLLVGMGLYPRASQAAESTLVVVEIDRSAGRLVDPVLTRRLIVIELGELEVPVLPTDAATELRSLFVRVIGAGDQRLRVELWELGRALGARELVFAEGTSEQLRARRIALVAAALGRDAALTRRRALQLAAEQERRELEARRAAAELPPELRLALVAGARGFQVGAGSFTMVGPRIVGALRLGNGSTLELGLASFAGGSPVLAGKAPATWSELSMAPGWAAETGPRSRIGIAVEIGAATVNLPRVQSVDAIDGQTTTWTARAAGRGDVEFSLGRGRALEVGVGVGALLRPIPVTDQSGRDRALGGLWLGIDLGWTLDPRRERLALVHGELAPVASSPR